MCENKSKISDIKLHNLMFEMVITFRTTVFPDGSETYTEDGEIMTYPIPDQFDIDQIDEYGYFLHLPKSLIGEYTIDKDYVIKIPISAHIQRKTSLKQDLFYLLQRDYMFKTQ